MRKRLEALLTDDATGLPAVEHAGDDNAVQVRQGTHECAVCPLTARQVVIVPDKADEERWLDLCDGHYADLERILRRLRRRA